MQLRILQPTRAFSTATTIMGRNKKEIENHLRNGHGKQGNGNFRTEAASANENDDIEYVLSDDIFQYEYDIFSEYLYA